MVGVFGGGTGEASGGLERLEALLRHELEQHVLWCEQRLRQRPPASPARGVADLSARVQFEHQSKPFGGGDQRMQRRPSVAVCLCLSPSEIE
eukprot:990972-Amphidinium_carterae.2